MFLDHSVWPIKVILLALFATQGSPQLRGAQAHPIAVFDSDFIGSGWAIWSEYVVPVLRIIVFGILVCLHDKRPSPPDLACIRVDLFDRRFSDRLRRRSVLGRDRHNTVFQALAEIYDVV
ncbi:hypothetical protein [Yoonia sp. 2307UL14-13]|uniref:hypothetical protein n=1 Tax=Yoonia sp. 2307UL14-13 TaxID=3126506 RepID=UPI0030AB42F9